MKNSIFLLVSVLFFNPLFSQINGNGLMETMTRSVANMTSIDVQFYADIILDFNQEETMVIRADENILKYINIDFTEGHLVLDQAKWIEPSKQPQITIGCPNLKRVFQGTHSSTSLINVKGDVLTLDGNVGNLLLDGKISELRINTTKTKVDARNLKIGTVKIGTDCKAKVTLDVYDELVKNDCDSPIIENLNANKIEKQIAKENAVTKSKVKFIKFRIKNNSLNRHAFYVKGPNGRGAHFSYGFSMSPFKTRHENWSIGTTIYKESRSGKLTELVVITKENEGGIVDLFE